MDAEGRAADLLERFEVLGMAGGLTEEDLYGDAVREPLCTCCSQLAEALGCLPPDTAVVDDPAQLASAAGNLKVVSASQQHAGQGRLQRALSRLVSAIDPAAKCSSRVEQLEICVAHLQAAHILAHRQQQQQQQGGTSQQQQAAAAAGAEAMQVDEAADTAALATAELRGLAKLLALDASRSRALPILQEVLPKLQALISQLLPSFFQPLVQSNLSQLDSRRQELLNEVDAALRQEYCLRRRMLIERVKVTLQSFLWSPRLEEQGTRGEVEALVAARQSQLQEQPAVALADLGSVTPADLAGVMRRTTSGESGSFDASVKRVIIGKVPDRGGRPEGRAREAGMPDWAPRRDTGAAGGGGVARHGRGGWRGGGGVAGRGRSGEGPGAGGMTMQQLTGCRGGHHLPRPGAHEGVGPGVGLAGSLRLLTGTLACELKQVAYASDERVVNGN